MASFLQANPLFTLGLLIFFMIGAVIIFKQFFLDEDPLDTRLSSIKKNQMDRVAKGKGIEKEDLWEQIKQISRKINPVKVLGEREVEKARKPLITAGYRGQDALTIFVLIKLLVTALLAGVGLLIVIVLKRPFDTTSYVIIFSGAILGSMLVSSVVSSMAQSRQERIRKSLPDVVDILLICIRSGMTFEGALQRILAESHEYMKEVNEELQVTLTEMQILRERETALKRFADRIDLDEVRILAASVIQAEKYGTSLSETFDVLSEEMRNVRILRAEAWAARAPVMLTIPMVFFLLPLLFIVVLGPGIIRVVETFGL